MRTATRRTLYAILGIMLPLCGVELSVVIAGPTAVGKTAVAMELGRRVPDTFEIVSADSVQIYRRFNIGSAKPSPAERETMPFHLIDVAEPDDDFTLVNYQTLALAAISEITAKGKIPLIVGGTGLYIRSITRGLGVPIAGPDEKLRAEYADSAKQLGVKHLHERLAAVDPESAQRIHENDLKRIIRGLEVHALTGKPLSAWHREDSEKQRSAPRAYIVLDRDREKLYAAIDRRAEEMFDGGIVEEVAALRADGYSSHLKPMEAVGYLQANKLLDSEIDRTEAVTLTKNATHQYARRQLIWFRGEPGTTWINVEGKSVEDIATEILQHLRL